MELDRREMHNYQISTLLPVTGRDISKENWTQKNLEVEGRNIKDEFEMKYAIDDKKEVGTQIVVLLWLLVLRMATLLALNNRTLKTHLQLNIVIKVVCLNITENSRGENKHKE